MLSFPWWLSLGVGFLSLSQEILWVRLIGFAYGNIPQSFSFVLANYLLGIAIGAAVGKRLCERVTDLYAAAGLTMLLAAVTDVLTPLIAPHVIHPQDNLYLPLVAAMVIATAAIKSALFPIAHHLGSVQSGPTLGRSVSRIYFGNIIGSTLGPLVTGFVLLDVVTLDTCFAMVGAICLAIAIGCFARSGARRRGVQVTLVVLVGLAAAWPSGDTGALEALANRRDEMPLGRMIQNKHGVVHTLSDPIQGDWVYGGNVYDGRVTVNAMEDPNGLRRVYLLRLLRPTAKRVLVIGMSTGAWVRALQGFPGIEAIHVVEINPAYLELVRDYPEIAPVLFDPRITIFVDDGRRWMKRNLSERYDLIVQNTTFHWRAYSTNLLSREYFEELKSHLSEEGVLAVNTTGSYDVFATAAEVFANAYRYTNFVYASDRSLGVKHDAAFDRLLEVALPEGRRLADFPTGAVMAELKDPQFEPVARTLAGARGTERVITDDNMITEYAHGRRFVLHRLSGWLLPAEPLLLPSGQ